MAYQPVAVTSVLDLSDDDDDDDDDDDNDGGAFVIEELHGTMEVSALTQTLAFGQSAAKPMHGTDEIVDVAPLSDSE